MTLVLLAVEVRRQLAAMEPAKDRPDDQNTQVLRNAGITVPQWSRPRTGRTTVPALLDRIWDQEPQWSRPILGRMTLVRVWQ